jgi:hypothetical protein
MNEHRPQGFAARPISADGGSINRLPDVPKFHYYIFDY